MRRFSRQGLPYHIYILIISFLFLQGCSRAVLQTYPVSDHETLAVSEAFERYRDIYQAGCRCCLDAEADAAVTVSGWFNDHAGKLSGYLQAMEPSSIKFVAINPLGQPFLILASDGKTFKSLNVAESKAYTGSVHSETFGKYTPAGFDPELSYYWLTGRLQPGDLQISEVMGDGEGPGYWLLIRYAGSATDHMVLFDPDKYIILRHILRDDRGKHLVDIHYGEYQLSTAGDAGDSDREICRVPAKITVSSRSGAEKIELTLSSFLSLPELSEKDFQLLVPHGFKQYIVN